MHEIAAHLQQQTTSNINAAANVSSVDLNNLNAHIGEVVHVCSKVYSTKYLTTARNAPKFIDLGAAYPNSPLTLMMWLDVRNSFSYAADTYLDGKNICVTGRLYIPDDCFPSILENVFPPVPEHCYPLLESGNIFSIIQNCDENSGASLPPVVLKSAVIPAHCYPPLNNAIPAQAYPCRNNYSGRSLPSSR